ncbi:hypothetical protein HY988_02725 [Candidatus Micrarchaeota archaeon]|nr:hypothetical protein [Candidatus Micrarchaeota archaeon]
MKDRKSMKKFILFGFLSMFIILFLAGCTEAETAKMLGVPKEAVNTIAANQDCTKLDESAQPQCWREKALATGKIEYCHNILTGANMAEYSADSNECFSKFAEELGSSTACDKILGDSGGYTRTSCKINVAAKNFDVAACSEISDSRDRNNCYNLLDQQISEKGCNDEKGEPRVVCVYSYAKLKNDPAICDQYFKPKNDPLRNFFLNQDTNIIETRASCMQYVYLSSKIERE